MKKISVFQILMLLSVVCSYGQLTTVDVFGIGGNYIKTGGLGIEECVPDQGNIQLRFDPNCPANLNGMTRTSMIINQSTVGGFTGSSSGAQINVTAIQQPGSEIENRHNKGRVTAKFVCNYDSIITVTPNVCPACPGEDPIQPDPIQVTIPVKKEGESYVDLYQDFDWDKSIVGPVCVQQGERVTYSIYDFVSGNLGLGIGLDEYEWTWPAAWTYAYNAADNSSITLDATTVQAGQQITVRVGRCNTQVATLDIVVNNPLEAPAVTFSPGQCFSSWNNYLTLSIPAVSGVTYTWDITADGKGYTFGHGNANATNIGLNVGNQGDGYVLLTSTSNASTTPGCDAPAPRTDTIYFYRTFEGATISGPSCVAVGQSYEYTLEGVAPDASVNWVFPSGYTITSANPNATTVTVLIAANAVQGNISASNANPACGGGAAVLYNVRLAPASPTFVSGPLCFNQNAGVNYTVSNVAGAENYYWTLPAGFSPGNGNYWTGYWGNTGNSLGGQITVVATAFGCPDSSPLVIEVNPIPNALTSIEADKSCLNNGVADQITLSTDEGYTTYNWTLPSGWVFVGANNTASVVVSTDGTGGTVSVVAENICGTSAQLSRTFVAEGAGNITITKVPSGASEILIATFIQGASYSWTRDGVALSETSNALNLTGGTEGTPHVYCVTVELDGCSSLLCESSEFNPAPSLRTASLEDAQAITISPNPAEKIVEINTPSSLAGIQFSIVDMNGVVLHKGVLNTNATQINVSAWASGTYAVKYEVAGEIHDTKFQVVR